MLPRTMPGTLRVGTSGYAYKEWRGPFYPEKLPEAKMLEFYSRRFSTVEINYTFYRLPSAKTVAGWIPQTPDTFTFALKGNQKITHIQRLRNSEELLKAFFEGARPLAEAGRLGPVLFQLPPNMRADMKLLKDFLAVLPRGVRSAFEFRHASWYSDALLECLRARGASLVIAETAEFCPPLEPTADFIYFRLRKEDYTPAELAAWRERFGRWLEQGLDLFVYFKHEDSGKAAAYAGAVQA